jgi:hypothetical protein
VCVVGAEAVYNVEIHRTGVVLIKDTYFPIIYCQSRVAEGAVGRSNQGGNHEAQTVYFECLTARCLNKPREAEIAQSLLHEIKRVIREENDRLFPNVLAQKVCIKVVAMQMRKIKIGGSSNLRRVYILVAREGEPRSKVGRVEPWIA